MGEVPAPPRALRRWTGYAIGAAVFALDRVTKWIIEANVSAFDRHVVIPGFFDIVHSENRGAAFGILNDSSSPFRTLFLVVFSLAAVGVIGAMLWNAQRLDRMTFYGLSLIFGGAAGNVYDRIVSGRVTDFLEFYVGRFVWPAFNAADSCIVIGSALLLLDMLRSRRQAAQT